MTIKIRLLSKEETARRSDPQESLRELQQTKQEPLRIIEHADELSDALRLPSMASFLVGASLGVCAAVYRSIPPLPYALIILTSAALMLAGALMVNPSIPLHAFDRLLDKMIARRKKQTGEVGGRLLQLICHLSQPSYWLYSSIQ